MKQVVSPQLYHIAIRCQNGTIFTGPPQNPTHHSRNICIFADAEVDRSPTGTGVSARLALHHAKSEITDGQQIVIESILGAVSAFGGRVVSHAQVGQYKAVVPEVSGKAFITGRHEFIIDPRDELGRGFFLSFGPQFHGSTTRSACD